MMSVFRGGHKSVKVDEYIPDLIAFDKIIVEVRAIEQITDTERAQLLNHLRISGFRVGLLLDFRKPKLEWERLVI